MHAAAGRDYSNVDCLAVAILTHGSKAGMLFGVDGQPDGQPNGQPTDDTSTPGMISIDHLLEPLKKCESLFGKPKLVFIQVCFDSFFQT